VAKSTFTTAQKAEAILLLNKGLTASAVCEKIGCSTASLQNWKKDYKEKKFSLDDMDEDDEDEQEEEEETTPPVPKPSKPAEYRISKKDFIESYWNRTTVSAVMKMPESIDEIVNLINDALDYAYYELL